MRNAGVVDINGASRDQFGWANSHGGLFTRALDGCLDFGLGKNWKELDEALQDQTEFEYERLRKAILANALTNDKETVECASKQEHQTPATFILSVQRVAETPAQDAPANPPR
jgi:hypothetical protein